jgi:hypothetical protein
MISFVQVPTMRCENTPHMESTKLHAKLHVNQRRNTCLRPLLRGETMRSRTLG